MKLDDLYQLIVLFAGDGSSPLRIEGNDIVVLDRETRIELDRWTVDDE